MKFSFKQFIVENFWKKFIFMTLGVFFMGFFLSVLIEVGWGTDPFSFMNLNLAHAIGLTLGTQQLLFNVLLSFVLFFFGTEMIGFGTLFNMIFVGYIADFFKWTWKVIGFHDFVNTVCLAGKIGVFAGAILLFVIAAAIYMNAQMGLSPYDGTGKILTNLMKKLPFFVARMIFDFLGIIIGFAASFVRGDGIQGSVIGSIAMAFLLGPAITLIGKPMAILFEGKKTSVE